MISEGKGGLVTDAATGITSTESPSRRRAAALTMAHARAGGGKTAPCSLLHLGPMSSRVSRCRRGKWDSA